MSSRQLRTSFRRWRQVIETCVPARLGRFISYDQCHRLFRLDLYERETRNAIHAEAGTKPELLSPALSESGDEWERDVEAALIDAGWFVTNLEGSSKAGLAHQYFHLTDDGDRRIVLQSELDGVLDGWEHMRQARPGRDRQDRPRHTAIADCRSEIVSRRQVRPPAAGCSLRDDGQAPVPGRGDYPGCPLSRAGRPRRALDR